MTPARRPQPEPLDVDAVRVVEVGTAMWLVALLAALAFRTRLADAGHESWPWICATGFAIGLFGVWYARRRRQALRRDADRRAAEEEAPPIEPLT